MSTSYATFWNHFGRPDSPTSSSSSHDEDEVNLRLNPQWSRYRNLLKLHGVLLETVRDVKTMYPSLPLLGIANDEDDALCPDPGLPQNLFRGSMTMQDLRVMVKAVHRHSREREVVRALSTMPLRAHPMNHSIPVVAIIDVDEGLSFIVMEEWSPGIVCDHTGSPCPYSLFSFFKQVIEHTTFMHTNRLAHLDISLRNLLTDCKGRYAFIDFEMSRWFNLNDTPRVFGYRGTEVPPECDNGGVCDPYKVDVWAVGVLILRASQILGCCVPPLKDLLSAMLQEDPCSRPTMTVVLGRFNRISTMHNCCRQARGSG